jgi:hypothetical protein
MRVLGFLIGALVAFAAAAEPARARYAGTQLQVAQENLHRAQAAAAAGDKVRAAALAQAAIVDARLTWAMSDAAPLRAAAAGVLEEAELLAGER